MCERWLRTRRTLLLITGGLTIAGLIITIGGFLYEAFTVGIPYPDPTPAQAAAQQRELAISDWISGIGIILFCLGGVPLGVHRLIRFFREF